MRVSLLAGLTALLALAGGGGLAASARRGHGHPPRACTAMASPLAHVAPLGGVSRAPATLTLGLAANMRSYAGRDRCRLAGLMQATGIRWSREDLWWDRTEPHPGDYRWGHFDALVRFAAQHGITILPLLDETPSWAGSGPRSLPDRLSDYAQFVAATARRYGPGGDFWRAYPSIPPHPIQWLELYNEPYYDGQDPGRYAELVRASAQAVSSVAPGVHLLAVANAGAWLDGMYAAVPDVFHYAAGVAVHPYSTAPPNAPPGLYTTRRVELMHATMTAHGDGAVPMWITEVGWSTCPASNNCVGERAQAADLAQTLGLAETLWSSYVRALFVYALHDSSPPRRRDDKEQWFGLLRPNNTPKRAWRVLAAATGRPR